ncbi:sulfatase-like hydrolase/transferase [candidate division CSSED10-310 bacterium]|uniref:Sulfatase-like hydrolase/transferase n=1 Tax=candidate division CSSED10-310 bacterium TaxID=2855610 RepID=A0ABV6YZU8_UNCC1
MQSLPAPAYQPCNDRTSVSGSGTRRDFIKKSLLSTMGLLTLGNTGPKHDPSTLKNIVLIITDDQRWDSLWAMPILKEKLIDRGVTFSNAYVTTPVCCPSRVSFLSGGYYAHNTGVITNSDGGNFRDTDSLATEMQRRGYSTGFIGKYLNSYYPGYIPPGWTHFVANYRGDMIHDWFNLEQITIGKSRTTPGQGQIIKKVRKYLTDFQFEQALKFLDQNGASPFFLCLCPYAPHAPMTPAPEDENKFPDAKLGPSHPAKNFSGKPAWLRQAVKHEFSWQTDRSYMKKLGCDYFRSLSAVDRGIGDIVQKIEDLGVTDDTLFVFTSDNGYLWGEHGVYDKGMPYEESIRVPLIIMEPGISPRVDHSLVAMNLDVPATLLELAHSDKKTDGLSLLPLLHQKAAHPRTELLIECFGYLKYWSVYGFESPGLGRWTGLRTKTAAGEWKYVEYPTGEKELYDLQQDPQEIENKYPDPASRNILNTLSQKLDNLKGLMGTVVTVPEGVVGENYSLQLTAWGGKKPYTWSIVKGSLPEGLALNKKTGLIQGIPNDEFADTIVFKVTSSSLAKHSHKPQFYHSEHRIIIKPSLPPSSAYE